MLAPTTEEDEGSMKASIGCEAPEGTELHAERQSDRISQVHNKINNTKNDFSFVPDAKNLE